ncbi:MAG TPA: type I methionyl aminopeptidase, partial [Anaeromyxobacteraceae bacterium]|nr:type I methionyl aminopeptidase [Anaeromyxobacteraceae bacterium]
LARMREAGRLVRAVLDQLSAAAVAGVSTAELDQLAEARTREAGAIPAFKGYLGYPASVCISVNEEVVHGIPSGRRLQDGDLVGLDFGAILGGFHGDSAVTVVVGRGAPEALRLVETTRAALEAGVAAARAGNRVGDIGAAVQGVAEAAGYSVVREFVGHGIGRRLHEPPQVPNFGLPGTGERLLPGMVIAIEPMVNAGRHGVVTLDDGWTAVTEDGSLSAHFEHTVAITEAGPEVLTRMGT